ncbi:hypothetical protein [Kordia sp.]|uniref:hypothetical protein n=1 Tax=Kordia sp. TaxID=1965332 RepID=UPI003D6C5FA4
MGEFNFKEESFKQFLKEKESQIYIRTKNGIQETDKFKNLHRSLVSYQNDRPLKDFTAFLISYEEVENIIENYTDKLFSILDSDTCVINNHLLFDRSFDLVDHERREMKDNNEARRYYLELSKEFCVFLISSQGVHYFIHGKDIGATIFFTSDALNSYNGLRDITKILELFEEYRSQHLKDRDTYTKFFVSNSSKRSLCKHLKNDPTQDDYKQFLKDHTQLLENKPEDRFREDLRMFLKRNLKANVLSKEYIMENFKRLDIFINDDFGELYLIEVKWVGISIHPLGQKVGTSYTSDDINPNAVLQSVDYIRQLYQENKNIKLGYLAVFDARPNNSVDTVESFDETNLDESLKKYYPKFKKIKDFKILNSHPN